MAQSIAANAQKLGVKNVTLIPSDYRGANVQIPLDEKSARLAEVNLSPGTKSQCSSLALWALNRNIPAYVLENFKIVGFGDNTPTRPLVDLKPEIRQIFFGKQ
jgi:hypothetical protein